MKKGVCVLSEYKTLLYILIIFASSFWIAEGAETQLSIQNSAPRFIQDIPNQTWAAGTNFSNAFDLDNYFEDFEGTNLTFRVAGNSSITISIDSNKSVSFSQPALFAGTEYVVFTASDGVYNTSSNNASLTVVGDFTAPFWSSAGTSKSTIYQSDIVNFTTIWQDTIGLSSFIFSINQGGGWANASGNFSGVLNTSRATAQIIYPAGTIVYWRFFAYDTSGNINGSDTFSFNISKRPEPPSSPPSGADGGSGGTGSGGGSSVGGRISQIRESVFGAGDTAGIVNFSVDQGSFYLTLKQGEARTLFLKITNIGSLRLNMSIEIEGLEKLVIINEKEFTLEPGETKTIAIDITTTRGDKPDLYLGKIKVSDGTQTQAIPLAILILPIDILLDLDLILSDEMRNIKPGNNISASLIIKNLRDVAEIRGELHLAIKNYDGLILDASTEDIALERVLYLNRTLFIPGDVSLGEHFFYARIISNDSVAIDAEAFEIGTRFRFASTIRRALVFFYFIIMMIVVILLMMRYQRNKKIEKALQLYLMLHELREMMEKGDLEKATQLYIRIKSQYKDVKVKETILNKEELKKEIEQLLQKLKGREELQKEEKKIDEKGKTEGKSPDTMKKEENVGQKSEVKEEVEHEEKKGRENDESPKESNDEIIRKGFDVVARVEEDLKKAQALRKKNEKGSVKRKSIKKAVKKRGRR